MEITKVVKPVHLKGVTQYFWQYSVSFFPLNTKDVIFIINLRYIALILQVTNVNSRYFLNVCYW